MYYLARMMQKIKPVAKKNSHISSEAKLEGGTQFINSFIGKYSFCGYDCKIVNTTIGSFCSIASNVKIGLGGHPVNWVSTSCAFYKGRDSISKDMAKLEYCEAIETKIGNDVWIGENALIKAGVNIADGAIIGMGSVLTKDVGAYEIWAGNPAKLIRKRFDDETIAKLQKTNWWNLEKEELQRYAECFNNTNFFLDMVEKKNS